MSALRAPAILLAVIVASELLGAPAARADDAPPVADDEVEAAAAAAVAFPDQRFGPRYVIDDVVVRGQPQDREVDHRRRGRRAGPGAGRRGRCVRSPRRGGPLPAARARLLPRRAAVRHARRQPGRRRPGRGGRGARHHRDQRAVPEHQRRDGVLGRGGHLRDQLPRARDQPGRRASSRRRRRWCPARPRGLGLRLRATVPPIGGPYGLSLSVDRPLQRRQRVLPGDRPADDSDPTRLRRDAREARGRRASASARTSGRACTWASTFARRR